MKPSLVISATAAVVLLLAGLPLTSNALTGYGVSQPFSLDTRFDVLDETFHHLGDDGSPPCALNPPALPAGTTCIFNFPVTGDELASYWELGATLRLLYYHVDSATIAVSLNGYELGSLPPHPGCDQAGTFHHPVATFLCTGNNLLAISITGGGNLDDCIVGGLALIAGSIDAGVLVTVSTNSGTVNFEVTRNDQPYDGVTLDVLENSQSIRTGQPAAGHLSFSGLTNGTYGYQAREPNAEGLILAEGEFTIDLSNVPPGILLAVADPSSVANSGSEEVEFRVTATDADGLIDQVTLDLRQLGGQNHTPMTPDTGDDFILTYPISQATPASDYDFPVSAIDDLGSGTSASINLGVTPSDDLADPLDFLGFTITANLIEETAPGEFSAEGNVTMQHSSGLALKLEATGGITLIANPPTISSQGEVTLLADLGDLGIYDLFHGEFDLDEGGITIDESANYLLDELVDFVLDTDTMDIDLLFDEDPGIRVTADLVLDIIDGISGNNAPRTLVEVTARASGAVSGSLNAPEGISWQLAAGTLSVDGAAWEGQTITIQDAVFEFTPGTFDQDRVSFAVPELFITPEGISANELTIEDIEFGFGGFDFTIDTAKFTNEYFEANKTCVSLPLPSGVFLSCVNGMRIADGQITLSGGKLQIPPLKVAGYDLASLYGEFSNDGQGNCRIEASGGLSLPVMGELGVALALDSQCQYLLKRFKMEMDLGYGIIIGNLPLRLTSIGGEIEDPACQNEWIIAFLAGLASLDQIGDHSLFSADLTLTLHTIPISLSADGVVYLASFQLSQAGLNIYPTHFEATSRIAIFADPKDFLNVAGTFQMRWDPTYSFGGAVDGELHIPEQYIPLIDEDVILSNFHGELNGERIQGEFSVGSVFDVVASFYWNGEYDFNVNADWWPWLYVQPATGELYGTRNYVRTLVFGELDPSMVLSNPIYHGSGIATQSAMAGFPQFVPIDAAQYASTQDAPMRPADLPDVMSALAGLTMTYRDSITTIDVPADAPPVLFHLVEQPEGGDTELAMTLITPGAVVVDSTYCAEHEGYLYYRSPDHHFYRIEEPEAGIWQIVVDDIDQEEEYLLESYYLNRRPSVAITEPSAGQSGSTADEYMINWDAEDVDGDSLLVTLTAIRSGSGDPGDSDGAGPWLLAEDLPDSVTSFIWRPAGMQDGVYRVIALVRDSHQITEADTCQYAIELVNSDPPTRVGNLDLRVGPEKVRITWEPVPDLDVLGYRLFYSQQDSARIDTLDVGNTDQLVVAALRNYEPYEFWVEAYDVMGQAGPASDVRVASPSPLGDADAPATPQDLACDYNVNTNVLTVTWTESEEAAGYFVHYDTDVVGGYDGTGALEGDSPVLQGRSGLLTLTGLTPGLRYYVTVTAFDAAGNESRIAVPVPILVSLFEDTDEDGLPDDWELMNLGSLDFGADDDPDEDLLTNEVEYSISLTHPGRADSDEDHVPDGQDAHPLDAMDSDYDGMADDWELHFGVADPLLDPDEDFLINSREFVELCSPWDPDTDSDVLGDGFEADSLGTDPWNPDTDGGGAWDGSEYFAGFDPLDPTDDGLLVGVEEDGNAGVPAFTHLQNPYPNPFNPAIVIPFGLAKPGRVSIKVFDIAGRFVTTVIDENRPAGYWQATWQGTDSAGSEVPSGIYLVRLDSGNTTESRKAVLLR